MAPTISILDKKEHLQIIVPPYFVRFEFQSDVRYVLRTPKTAEHVEVGASRSPHTYVPASDVSVLKMVRLRRSSCQVTMYLERF